SMVSSDGEVGRFMATPQNQAEIGDGYDLLAGEATIDLEHFEFVPGEPAELDIDIAFGQLTVVVPRDAYVEMDGSMQAGQIVFFDTQRNGQGVTFVDNDGDADSEARVSLHVEGAVGQIEVERSPRRALFEPERPRPEPSPTRTRATRERP
ncbi:MAG: LiaF domain-containing protein, partial [Actinomycetota bacterium]